MGQRGCPLVLRHVRTGGERDAGHRPWNRGALRFVLHTELKRTYASDGKEWQHVATHHRSTRPYARFESSRVSSVADRRAVDGGHGRHRRRFMDARMMGAAPYGEYGHPSVMYNWDGMYAWMYGRGVYGAGAWWPWFGLVAGFLLIVGGFAVYLNPRRQHAWGAAIIVISALDFLFGMGGLVAAVLGAVAGLVALAA